MAERIPCQNVGCSATILPATALKTGGTCMPCHQKKLAREREAYILQNRKDVDRYDGVTDSVEILKIMHAPRPYDPLVREIPYPISAQELYRQLTAAEREHMETYAISLIEQEDLDQAEKILLSLVCFTDERIERGLTQDGGYSWSPLNIVPEYLPDTDPDEEILLFPLRLSDRPMGMYEGAYWTLEAPASQIGGHPAWIQDAEYPACPCCQETMAFIGQIDMEQEADSEGIYYAFLCGACLIAAVNYQQS
ncbi:hypothetical protein ACFSR7_16635 [Cohnella sp. GCM10020058]|uniref:hypothetical protein n=1 Tax=Cohnella sp. GCM10020058 TaxID=3317330 RepID=UPI0036275FCC